MKSSKWDYSNAEETGKYVGLIEFQDNAGEFHDFYIYATDKRLVFGGATNTGFLESGYMLIDDCFSIDENLQEIIADLECFYNDGRQYTSMIVCNDRM